MNKTIKIIIVVLIFFCSFLVGCATTPPAKWTGESITEKTQIVKIWYETSYNDYARRWFYYHYMTVDGDGTFRDNRHVIEISQNFYNKILIGDTVIITWYKYDDGYWRIESYYRND